MKKTIAGSFVLLALSSSAFAQFSADESKENTGGWEQTTNVDEMTGEKTNYLLSPVTTNTKKMGFPYGNLASSMGFGCSKKGEWAYFWFKSSPNITDRQVESGYNTIKTRIKFGDVLDKISLVQDWGAETLHAQYPKWLIKHLKGKSTTMLELNWYGSPGTTFKYNTAGFDAAYKAFHESCKAL